MNRLHCETAYEWIVRDLDEGLEPEKRLILNGHLLHCAKCRELREQTASLLALLPEDVPPVPDEAFWLRYRSCIDAKLRERACARKPWWSFDWRVAVAGFSVAVLLLLALEPLTNDLHPQWKPTAEANGIMKELNDVYGPVSDEITTNSMSQIQVTITVDSLMSFTGPDLMTWFDIQDQTNSCWF